MTGRPAKRRKLPKAEREKQCDMPRASLKTVRRAFFRPFDARREGAG